MIKIYVWTFDMTSRSYFGKMNSTLGSVVPLAMFQSMKPMPIPNVQVSNWCWLIYVYTLWWLAAACNLRRQSLALVETLINSHLPLPLPVPFFPPKRLKPNNITLWNSQICSNHNEFFLFQSMKPIPIPKQIMKFSLQEWKRVLLLAILDPIWMPANPNFWDSS